MLVGGECFVRRSRSPRTRLRVPPWEPIFLCKKRSIPLNTYNSQQKGGCSPENLNFPRKRRPSEGATPWKQLFLRKKEGVPLRPNFSPRRTYISLHKRGCHPLGTYNICRSYISLPNWGSPPGSLYFSPKRILQLKRSFMCLQKRHAFSYASIIR